MNKLKTTDNGGMPLDLNDIRWLVDGIQDAIKGTMAHYGEYFIITGCDYTISGGNVNVNAGWAMIAGEVCYVPAKSFTDNSPLPAGTAWAIRILETYDSEGLETFQDGQSYDTYAIRQGNAGEYTTSIVGGGTEVPHEDYLPLDGNRLEELIAQDSYSKIPEYIESWNDLTLGSSWSANLPTQYRKEFGKVHIKGVIVSVGITGTGTYDIGTLPNGYRPPVVKDYYVDIANTDFDPAKMRIYINTAGNIRFAVMDQAPGNPPFKVVLDHLPPFEPA